jgi:hypothetical protein
MAGRRKQVTAKSEQAARPGTKRVESPTDAGTRRVFVLGAGADVAHGVPTVAHLMRELAAFVKSEGEPVDKALRKKLPYLHFSFDRYAAGRGDALVAQLFTDADDLVPSLSAAAQKLKSDATMAPVGEMIEQLCTMAASNRLTGTNLEALAKLAGEQGQIGSAEPILDPQKISLSHTPAAALRSAFQQALARGQDFSQRERQVLELFIVSTSNIEELLSHYFTLYTVGKQSDQKTFLYIAWLLWAYLRLKSTGRTPRSGSIYSRLPSLGGDVITFNYTNFFVGNMAGRAKYFHGRLDRYLRTDDRTTVSDDAALRTAISVEAIVSFLDRIRLDVAQIPHVDFPAIVPPISFKPVMSREQLLTWAEADACLQKADQIVIVGYSFATADEHFNDLLRKTRASSRVFVVNPDLDAVLPAACRILDTDPQNLAARQISGFQVKASRRITGVAAKAEEVDADLLMAVSR